MWITLAAIVILLIGTIVWGIMGELTIHHEDGTVETVAPISFIIN